MEKAKFHPLTLIALTISSLTMALYAYQNFKVEETSYGILFTLLSILIMGLAIHGLVRNRRSDNSKSHES